MRNPPLTAARAGALAGLCLATAFSVSRAQSSSSPSTIELDRSLLRQTTGVGGTAVAPMGSYRNFLDAGSGIGTLQTDLVPYVGDAPLADSLYIVGPGDMFQLHLGTESLERQVSPEGYIVLNRIGAVQLEGLTLRQAKARLLDRLATAYKRSDCFVGLSRPKTMRIFVTGAVNGPGAYELPGNSRLADAIRLAGGYAASAQKEDVRITLDGKTFVADLQKFYMTGDVEANPMLRQGSVIHVPFLDYSRPWVIVRRDGASLTVQADSGATLAALILKSYAFSPPAPYHAVLVREKSGRETVVAAGEAAGYRPEPEAYLEVIPARQEIFVAGAVAAPGLQPHVAERRIIQYISTAGLLTSSKLPNKIEVVRANGKRLSLPIQSSALQPGDVLFVRQNAEQKFLIYTPILLSFVSLSLAVITVFGINQ